MSTKTRKSADAAARDLIGQAIQIRRKKADMTLPEAAEALGVDERTLRRWESGSGSLWTGGDAGNVDHAMMTKLKEIYGARASELYPRNQYPNAPLDPAKRREHIWHRNAKIQGVADVDATVDRWRAQYEERLGMKRASPRPDA